MSSPYLPPEILDYIANLLHDDPNALKRCCLASTSWVPRTRKHLFAQIRLNYEKHLESWKKTFPDPSISPAHFAKSLHVGCAHAVTAADAEAGGWLIGFDHISHLGVETCEMYRGKSPVSLIPFHRLSPTIKSLRVNSINLPPSRIFNFTLSCPLLEDLTVFGDRAWIDDGDGSNGPPTSVQPSHPPVFAGSLQLFLEGGMNPIAGRLLSTHGGIHFRKLTLTWYYARDLLLITALVMECSHTLESLYITSAFNERGSTSVDLLKATRLKDVTFQINSPAVEWVTIALRTIAPGHRDLRRISITADHFSTIITVRATNVLRNVEEQTRGQWAELDCLLVQFRELYSIPPRVVCYAMWENEGEVRDLMGRLLPETTGGGMANLFPTWC